MFADPQSLTVAGVAKSMPRVSNNGYTSIYQKDDETYKFTISHSTSNGRVRTMVRVDRREIVADPLTAVNDYETLGIYLVIDRPEVGFSATQINDVVAAMETWFDATSVGKLFGKES